MRPRLLPLVLCPTAALAQAAPAQSVPAQTAPWRGPGPERPPPPRGPARQFMLQVDFGASLRSLHGVALYGGDLRALFASRNARWCFGGGPIVHLGQTERGRTGLLLGARVSAGAFVGRFTLGGGVEVAWLDVIGVSSSGNNILLGIGLHATAYVDLLRTDLVTFTLGLDGSALLHAEGRLLSGALLLGFRR